MKRLAILLVLSLLGLMACGGDGISFRSDGGASSDPGWGSSGAGVGGSYARMILTDDRLLVVTGTHLRTFDISDPHQTKPLNAQYVGPDLESIFQLGDRLYIGSGSGLYIYAVYPGSTPLRLGYYSYDNLDFPIRPCDPVVADSQYAFVTLNTEVNVNSPCGSNTEWVNELLIFDVTDPVEPELLVRYDMFRPKGVGLDGHLLFVCDHTKGLRVFDVSDVFQLAEIAAFPDYTAYDVIPLDGLLLVIGPASIVQYDYSDPADIRRLSVIPLNS